MPELVVSHLCPGKGKGWGTPGGSSLWSPRWPSGFPWASSSTSKLAQHRLVRAASPSCSIPSSCQRHQQQWQCSKVPPPSSSYVPCPSVTKLPLCSLAPSAKRGPQEGAPCRPTLRSGTLLLPRSPNHPGAEPMSQPGDTLACVQWGGNPKPTAPTLHRWAANYLLAGDLHLSSDHIPGMTFKGKMSLCWRI